MICAICGPYPKLLGFDGVSLAMAKDKVNWEEVETVHPKDEQHEEEVAPDVLKYVDRVLLCNTHTRDLLRLFCKGDSLVTTEQFHELVDKLDKECQPLAALLRNLHEKEVQRTLPLPVVRYSFAGSWKDFLALLASDSSLAWIIRPAIVPLLLHIITKRVYDASSNQLLNSYCPQLACGLATLKDGSLTEVHVQLLQRLVDKVKATYSRINFEPTAPPQLDTAHASASVATASTSSDSPPLSKEIDRLTRLSAEMQRQGTPLHTIDAKEVLKSYTVLEEKPSERTGTYWSFPKIRSLPRFKGLDPKPRTVVPEWRDEMESALLESKLFCFKEELSGYSSRKHTAGLFIGCCLHHIVYGFHMMVSPEGRKDLLKVLYERFPQEVLDQLLVLYDFNCNEGEYMLNRVPHMFAYTRLFIDRFHAKNHHSCASTFKLQAFPVYQELVSTGNEVYNSFIQQYHNITPFMTQSSYVKFISTLTGLHNLLLNVKFQQIMKVYNFAAGTTSADSSTSTTTK